MSLPNVLFAFLANCLPFSTFCPHSRQGLGPLQQSLLTAPPTLSLPFPAVRNPDRVFPGTCFPLVGLCTYLRGAGHSVRNHFAGQWPLISLSGTLY